MGAGLANINIYNLNSGSLEATLSGHTSGVNDLVLISSDLLASSSNDLTVKIWNLTTNTMKFNLIGHNLSVHGLKLVTNDILSKWVF